VPSVFTESALFPVIAFSSREPDPPHSKML
jgi:hypothetical protein